MADYLLRLRSSFRYNRTLNLDKFLLHPPLVRNLIHLASKMSGKVRLRRFCLLMSYSGRNYLGMQRNPGTKTIEDCLLRALKEVGIISEEEFLRPQLMYFQRSARTDKSVSAVKQTVSMKILESIKTRLDEINKVLPDDIRLMGCKRVTQSFDAKNHCDGRTYAYLIPTFALCPLTEISEEGYRVSEEIIDLFNSTLEGYIGTHKFHNFTSGKTFKEDSSVRVIKSMSCSKPFFPCNQEEIEFVVIRVRGQSFMMHQIRKMIGLAIAVVKGYATEEHIKRSMEEAYMDIPKAPGLGLMLEEVHFDRYNRKFGCDGMHVPIEWSEHNEAIGKFKEDYIYPEIVNTERKEKSMMNWLHTLSLHSYGDVKTISDSTDQPIIPFEHYTNILNKIDPQDAKDDQTEKDDETEQTHSKKIKLDESV